MSAENMVFSRRGLGGPQLGEVDRMLSRQQSRLVTDVGWAIGQRERLQAAQTALERSFAQLTTLP